MTLQEAGRKLLDAKINAPSRALLMGYIVMVKLYGWQGFGGISARGSRKIRKLLRDVGVIIDDVCL